MFISKKKLNQLLSNAKNEGYESGYKDGYSKGNKKGYSKGLHEGLTRDKKGVLYTHNGLYAFEDEEKYKEMNKQNITLLKKIKYEG
ncbi:hypothetical protein [Oceanobacillus sojae]|uniref:Essential protein Yae1 N-terminal domain-containing protein n=1 Tax=Oceanobacillus sojae TaxID=582851 RepID=A0A511ZIK3_9BACI|nr:hypothetical protein [Oceanobacillus sojae]GEN87260.1 hypothetical protein OSO01_19990 [Oceanobacillus sojae]